MEELPTTLKKGGLSLLFNVMTVLFLTGVTIVATRKLEPADYGLYQFILALAQYSLILINIDTWFATRYLARNNDIRKEAILIGFIFTTLESVIFFIILFYLRNVFSFNQSIILTGTIYIAIVLISAVLNSLSFSINVVNYYVTNFIQAITRFFILLLLIYLTHFNISVELLIVVIILSIVVSLPYQIRAILRFKSNQSNNRNIKLRNIIKRLWYYPVLVSLISILALNDSVFMGLLLFSTLPIAFFRTAYVVSNSINYVQAFTNVYYREFLSKGDVKQLEQAIKTNILYTTLICFLIFAEGNLIISIFRPIYVLSYNAAIILAFSFIFLNLSNLLSQAILGFERSDIEVESKLNFKDSAFFSNFKVDLYSLILQYIFLTLIIFITKNLNLEAYQVAIFWSIAWLATYIFSFILRFKLAKKYIQFHFPLVQALKYSIISLISGIVIFLIRPYTILGPIYYQIGVALFYALMYIIIYLPLILSLDKSFRRRFIALLRSIKFF
jgi:O-antigen/teichoic acid export membrane protein